MTEDPVLTRRGFLGVAGTLASAVATDKMVGSHRSAPSISDTQPSLLSSDESTAVSPVQQFHSRPDLQPPVVSIAHPPNRVAPGLIITDCHNGPGQQGPLIIDSEGNLVWFKPLSKASGMPKAFNLRVQSYKGAPVLSWFEGEVVQAHGQGHYELYDSSYRQVAEVHAGNGYVGDLHEFFLTEQGTAIFTCYGTATGDLSQFGGSPKGSYFYGVVQEVDVATGKVLFQWLSNEHIGFDESYSLPAPKHSNTRWDYLHINSVGIDPSDGNLVISGRNTFAFYKVNRTTGALMWRAGGKKSDFKLGPNAAFAFQHDVTPRAGGIFTIFDNEAGPPQKAPQSRALVVRLDEKHKQMSLVRQIDHLPLVVSGALGSVQVLSNGHFFVGWGESSFFSEYDPLGNVVLDGRLASGNVCYRAFKQPWTGRPEGQPAVAVRTSGGTTTVYASWNGSTVTAYWVVLGGLHASQLSGLLKASRRGFETVIPLPSPPAYVAVEALDSAGHSLGRSNPVRVN